ncbi:MAG: hypothetical protein JW900_04460 [Anaerolineae bacterium]|nr:hypothetical protein [Anaerolineae bacterium]
MATIRQDGPERRITCDVPECRRRRERRGQENGRFLLSLRCDGETVTVTVVCPECGGTHTVTVPVLDVQNPV